jgi:hypothetical protein
MAPLVAGCMKRNLRKTQKEIFLKHKKRMNKNASVRVHAGGAVDVHANALLNRSRLYIDCIELRFTKKAFLLAATRLKKATKCLRKNCFFSNLCK